MFNLSRAERAAWIALIGFSVLFVAYPEIDLAISRGAYLDDGSFILTRGPIGRLYYDARDYAVGAVFLVLLGATILNLADASIELLTPREILSVLVSISLAPGLIANVLLKEQFGRARPSGIVEFGGSMTFTPAWIRTDQCVGNCSFVSGDVAFAFIGLALALCCTRGRGYAVVAAIVLGVAVGAIRVLQGAHFASDSIVGGLIALVTVLTVHRVLVFQPAATGLGFIAPGGWLDTWPAKVRQVFQGKAGNQATSRRPRDN